MKLRIRISLTVLALCGWSLQYVQAETTRQALLDDPQVVAIVDAVREQFSCGDRGIHVYLLQEPKGVESPRLHNRIVEFDCVRGMLIRTQIRFNRNSEGGVNLNTIGSLADVDFYYTAMWGGATIPNLETVNKEKNIEEVISESVMIQKIASAISSTSTQGCFLGKLSKTRNNARLMSEKVRDESGLKSQLVGISLTCPSGNNYFFTGVYYPSKAFIKLRGIEHRVVMPCG